MRVTARLGAVGAVGVLRGASARFGAALAGFWAATLVATALTAGFFATGLAVDGAALTAGFAVAFVAGLATVLAEVGFVVPLAGGAFFATVLSAAIFATMSSGQ